MTEAELRALTFGFRGARAVMAAVSLGVLDRLAEGPADAAALAADRGLAPRGAETLLGALAAIGVVERDDAGRFHLGPAAAATLTCDAPRPRTHVVRHDLWHQGLWARLEEAVASGRPLADRSQDPFFRDPAVLGAFFPNLAGAMDETAREEAPALVEALALRGDERLLDAGCGAATHALALARAHPALRVEALDLGPVAAEAQRAVASAGLEGRVAVRAADLRADPLDPDGEGFDVVLLSRVLMGFPDDDAVALLRRVREVLRPGGRVAVHAFRRAGGAERVAALLDLDMLLLTGGAVRDAASLGALLRAAGFGPPRSRPVGSLGLYVEATR